MLAQFLIASIGPVPLDRLWTVAYMAQSIPEHGWVARHKMGANAPENTLHVLLAVPCAA